MRLVLSKCTLKSEWANVRTVQLCGTDITWLVYLIAQIVNVYLVIIMV